MGKGFFEKMFIGLAPHAQAYRFSVLSAAGFSPGMGKHSLLINYVVSDLFTV